MSNRVAYHTDESFAERRGNVVVYHCIVVTEDEAGYSVLCSDPELFRVEEVAARLNALAGLTKQDVLDIRTSSMRAQNHRDAMDALLGTPSYDRYDSGARTHLDYFDRAGTIRGGVVTTTDERHDADGEPYIAYYRNDAVRGFIWSGKVSDWVQVTREMGEPIIDTFPLTGSGAAPSLADFKAQCDRYLDIKENQ